MVRVFYFVLFSLESPAIGLLGLHNFEPPAVGLLGLCHFELSAVGLPGLRSNYSERE